MIRIYITFFILFELHCAIDVFSQEVCNNCIDDDGDGLIDCYDNECFDDGINCADIYLNSASSKSSCQEYLLDELWTISGNFSLAQFVVGDVDKDGIPEVLINSGGVYNGIDGALENTFPAFKTFISIADVDKNNDVELFYADASTFNRYEYGSNVPTWTNNTIDVRFINFADIDMDGVPEVFSRLTILESATGAIIIDPVPLLDPLYRRQTYAVDILPDEFAIIVKGLS